MPLLNHNESKNNNKKCLLFLQNNLICFLDVLCMRNHVHLLMKAVEEDLDTIFRRIGTSYVFWNNWRGSLFKDWDKNLMKKDGSGL